MEDVTQPVAPDASTGSPQEPVTSDATPPAQDPSTTVTPADGDPLPGDGVPAGEGEGTATLGDAGAPPAELAESAPEAGTDPNLPEDPAPEEKKGPLEEILEGAAEIAEGVKDAVEEAVEAVEREVSGDPTAANYDPKQAG